jgi:hypothetical protein
MPVAPIRTDRPPEVRSRILAASRSAAATGTECAHRMSPRRREDGAISAHLERIKAPSRSSRRKATRTSCSASVSFAAVVSSCRDAVGTCCDNRTRRSSALAHRRWFAAHRRAPRRATRLSPTSLIAVPEADPYPISPRTERRCGHMADRVAGVGFGSTFRP